MTYASGGLIQATDFNTRVSSVNTLWGTGSNSSGYGQSTTVSTNSAGTIVPASDWATLIARMQSMQQHQQNNTTGVPSQPTSGSIITYLSTVDSCITTITSNKLNGYTNTVSANYDATAASSTAWITSASRIFTVTFSSGDAARYFFNSNGYIETSFVNTSLSGNSKSTFWNAFLTSGVKQHVLRASSSFYTGTGFTPNTNLTSSGYYNLNRGLQTFFQVYDTPSSVDYVNNYITIAYDVATAQNAGGNGDNGSVIVIKVDMFDAAGDVFNDNVTGNTCVQVRVAYPETTYIANTWGAITVAANVNTQS